MTLSSRLSSTPVAAFVAAALLVSPCKAQDQERLPNLNFVGAGYDILQGNPHPTSGDGARSFDPGFRQSIFDLEQPGVRVFQTRGVEYAEPAGVEVLSASACSFAFSSRQSESASDYRDSLRVGVDANFEGWGASFKASADFQQVRESYEESNHLIIESSSSCSFYSASINFFDPPPVTSNFRAGVQRLTVEFDSDVYERFLEEFGTHMTRQVEFGGIVGQRTEISATALRTLDELGVDVSLAAEASGFGVSGGGSIQTDFDQKLAQTFSSESESQTMFSYGGQPIFPEDSDDVEAARQAWGDSVQADPLPLTYSLIQITDLITDVNFPNDTDIEFKKYNLELALSQYCQRLEGSNQIEGFQCSDRSFDVEAEGRVGNGDAGDLEAWDEGAEWVRQGQPALTSVRMWFDEGGLTTIQGVYERNNLRFKSAATDWNTAELECGREGAHLVSVHSNAEHERMVTFLARLFDAGELETQLEGDAPSPVHIGLNDLATEDIFLWSDGSEVDFGARGGAPWGSGQPDNTAGGDGASQDCGAFRLGTDFKTGNWDDRQCGDSLPYVCQWPREHGLAPDHLRVPVEFNLEADEHITEVQVCDADRIGSLRFTTNTGRRSTRFSFETVLEEQSCLFTDSVLGPTTDSLIGYSLSNSLSLQEKRDDCQSRCLSNPDCNAWRIGPLNGDTYVCRLFPSTTLTVTTDTAFNACPRRTCVPCSGKTPFNSAVDGCVSETSADITDQCLDTSTGLAGTRCCNEDATECTSLCDGINHQLVSYDEAASRCSAAGMRLCTGAELATGVCCNTGCNFDANATWTLDACGTEEPQCTTITFSDRLGLVHLAGSNVLDPSTGEATRIAQLEFYGFAEKITEQLPLAISDPPVQPVPATDTVEEPEPTTSTVEQTAPPDDDADNTASGSTKGALTSTMQLSMSVIFSVALAFGGVHKL